VDIEFEDLLLIISQQVLIVAGRHDRATSIEAARGLARGIPNAELVKLENSGHFPFVEETVASLDAVRTFLSRTVADPNK